MHLIPHTCIQFRMHLKQKYLFMNFLNLLIALMSDSFERIKEREEQEYTYQKAKMIVDIEVKYKPYKELRAHRFPKYVHVLKPDKGQDMQETEWFGVAGQIRKDLYRTQHLVNDYTKDQLSNPNTGLMAVIKKDVDDIVDKKIGAIGTETGRELKKVQAEVNQIKQMIQTFIEQNGGPQDNLASTAGSYKGGTANSESDASNWGL